jgi:hypothetical protein
LIAGGYLEFLKQKIFKTAEFDQFNLLFDALARFLARPTGEVAILERSYIYGGRSLFAPLLPAGTPTSIIDYRPVSADSRSNYQGHWIDQCGLEFPTAAQEIVDLGTGYRMSFSRLDTMTLLVPNVLHHCRDFADLVGHLQAAMPQLQRVFVFDSYLREGHQTPDDFCRYTPSALERVMRAGGFGRVELEETGNVFDAILYLISQARWQLENAPELAQLKQSMDELEPILREIRRNKKYRPLGRPHAYMATAYAMSFER